MIRIIAFALQAHEDLVFTKGLSETDEPDLWIKDLTDAISLWVEIGQPDERRILKACGPSENVELRKFNAISVAPSFDFCRRTQDVHQLFQSKSLGDGLLAILSNWHFAILRDLPESRQYLYCQPQTEGAHTNI